MSGIFNTSWVEIEGMSVAVTEPEDYLSPQDLELDQLSSQLDNFTRIAEAKRLKQAESAKARRRMMR